MSPEHAIDLMREVLRLTIIVAGPLLGVALLIGVVSGLFQTATQMHEHTIGLVPKLIGVAIAVAVSLPWLIARLMEFTRQIFGEIPHRMG